MSFSPRPRPQTVALSGLSFTSDLTDDFRDCTSVASSPAQRHPRGDTPLSRRTYSAQAGEWESPGRSSRWTASEGGGDEDEGTEREKSNLDKLLDFLDDDDDEQEQRTSRAARATSTPPPPHSSSSSRPPPPPTTIRRAPPCTAAYLPSPSSTRASDSPSIRAHHRSFSSVSHNQSGRSGSALARLRAGEAAGGSGGGKGRGGAPDSPSPRPGSVEALRRKGEGSSSGFLSGLMSGVSLGERSAGGGVEGKWKERAEEEREEKDEQEQVQGEETEGGESLDSVARVAQAAMDEFDTIISHGASSSHHSSARPASRLRNIPSPVRTPTPPGISSSSRPPAQYRPSSRSPPAEHAAPHPTSGDLNAHNKGLLDEELNVQLVQELREAQDYIAYLQDELRSIGEVVRELRSEEHRPQRGEGEKLGFAGDESRRTSGFEPPRRQDRREDAAVLEETAGAAFEVVKHLLTTLPSHSPSSSSSSSPHPPSLTTLALALRFTREIDQLAHASPGLRRDEDVFTAENLERVGRRVGGWERAVREGGRN
ncbi:hypothetical protein JCM8547_001335 [Rhodosporidiobolus lusitaniae]